MSDIEMQPLTLRKPSVRSEKRRESLKTPTAESQIGKAREEANLKWYNSYYLNKEENSKDRNLGILLVVDIRKIETDIKFQFDEEDKLSKERQEEFTKQMRKKSTLKQVKTLLDKLIEIGLTIEQNKGSEDDNIFFIRISMTEIGLMETADKMGLDKKMKPIRVPPLATEKKDNNGNLIHIHNGGPIVEGGHIPFSMSRCDAYNKEHQVNNVWQGLLKVLPVEKRTAYLDEDLLTKTEMAERTSEKRTPKKMDAKNKSLDDVAYFEKIAEVYKAICPEESPGVHANYVNYPGLFLRPEESGGASMFTDAEKATIIIWKIKNDGGIHLDITDILTGAGNLVLRKKLDSTVLQIDDLEIEKLAKPPTWIECCFPKKSYPRKMIASGYAKNPIGLIHFEAFTPTHDPVIKEHLLKNWALGFLNPFRSCSSFFSLKGWKSMNQPIEEIKEYFGVKIALYFLFIGHLIESLIMPSLLGIALIIYNYYFSLGIGIGYMTYDSDIAPYYSFYLIGWGISFLGFWKRKQMDYAIKWGTVDLEREMSFRRDWLDYYEAIEGTDDPDSVDLLKSERYDALLCINKRNYWGFGLRLKQYFTMSTVLLSIFCTLIAVFSIFVVHSWTVATGYKNGTTYSLVASSVIIVTLGFVYKDLAYRLNRWENHKTDVEEEDALISKSFLFDFFNSYSALLFIAFGDAVITSDGIRSFMLKIFNNVDVTSIPCLDQSSDLWNQYLALPPGGDILTGSSFTLGPRSEFALSSIITQMWNFNGSYEPLAWSGNDPNPGPMGQSSTGVSQYLTPTGLGGYENITNSPSALVIGVMDTYCATQWCNYGSDQFDYVRAQNYSNVNDLLQAFTPYPNTFMLSAAFGTCAPCVRNDCISEIASQLLTILLLKSMGFKFVFGIIPWLTQCFLWCRRRYVRQKKESATWFEQEYNLDYYVDVSAEYQELAVMYGYIMLFAVTFPIAPIICYITTNVEMRADALKVLNSRRAIPLKVPNIGAWYSVFNRITQISILSNVGMICFVANRGFFPIGSGTTSTMRWEWMFFMCLIALFCIWVIGELLPDVAESSLKLQVQIRSKIEYIHKLLRYQQYYESQEKIFDLFPTADKDNTDMYMHEGYHLSKNEMLKLRLNQLIIQEEQIDSKRIPVSSRNIASLTKKTTRTTSLNKESNGAAIIQTLTTGKKTLPANEMLKMLKSKQGNSSIVFSKDDPSSKEENSLSGTVDNPLNVLDIRDPPAVDIMPTSIGSRVSILTNKEPKSKVNELPPASEHI